MEPLPLIQTARVQYVFLDVVGFTRNRSVEAQSDVVGALNALVGNALLSLGLPVESIILLPTGDGIAIALIDLTGVDVHLKLALEILRKLAEHNGTVSDPMRRFDVRIGLNENIDNVLDDINGRRNVAGAGISMALRIMDKADGGQILVGSTVYEMLRQRESYMSSFRGFDARAKHNVSFKVYQFVAKDAPGLNVQTPSAFLAKKREPERLTEFAAYYIAHAVTNREFLLSRRSDPTRDYTAAILLSFVAEDSEDAADTPTHQEPTLITWRGGVASFQEQYEHYSGMEFWPLARFSALLTAKHLQQYAEHFEWANYQRLYWLVKTSGIQKLIAEWPRIAQEFSIKGENTG